MGAGLAVEGVMQRCARRAVVCVNAAKAALMALLGPGADLRS